MQNQKVSKRYAKALFDRAKEEMQLDAVLSDLSLISTILADSNNFFQTLKSPVIKQLVKQNIIKTVFEKKLNILTLNFLNLIIHKGREGELPRIITEYQSLYNISNNIVVAEVVSAKPLDSDLRGMIKEKINDSSNVKLEEIIDPNLIGGFIITSGDKQYDASVKKQLNKLKQAFTQ